MAFPFIQKSNILLDMLLPKLDNYYFLNECDIQINKRGDETRPKNIKVTAGDASAFPYSWSMYWN